MSSVEPHAPRGPFNAFRRLDLLYFVLAGFDLLTICAALFLNHMVTTAFEEGVRTSAAWSSRQVEIIHLSRLAQQADAPGNDIFSSDDVALERARHLDAATRFDAEWRRLTQALAHDALSSSDTELLSHLTAARDKMAELRSQSTLIFIEYERGHVSGAGRQMAAMDRIFGELSANLDQALAVVERTRDAHLQGQVAYARNMRTLELLIASAVLIIVCLVAAYGMHIGRTMRASQEQRLVMLGELTAARDRLQRYADDVSHELRGPISKMRLDAEVLLRHDRAPGEYREGVEAMLVESERVSGIVESLLFMARADNTRVAINHQALDAGRELTLIVDFYSASAETAQISLGLIAGVVPLWADRSLFQRAVSNLVSNAIDHTPPGGRVTLSARADGASIVVEVADSGAGMSEEVRARMFDRFYRGADGRGRTGLGLGLAITKSIMDLHGGAIEVASEAGAGTRARLIFPANIPQQSASPA
jgi:signal transduction histidine kinase